MASQLNEPSRLLNGTPSDLHFVIPAAAVKHSPTPEEWEHFRPEIAGLYREHILREVMKIMRDRHEFHAT